MASAQSYTFTPFFSQTTSDPGPWWNIAGDGDGSIYAPDYIGAILKISSVGSATIFAGGLRVSGSADGVGGAARFDHPVGVTLGGSGNLDVADSLNHTIRKITAVGCT